MTTTLTTTLRFGWTTGTCATAAVNAAFTALVTGSFPENVSVITPSGKEARLDVAFQEQGPDWAKAGIVKDAGDDPDVTHGALICAKVRFGRPGSGVAFLQGEGVGTVTKAGLPIAVGEPSINPVPRKMMRAMVDAIAARHGVGGDVTVEISVPNGAEIALKTWNPRLGIEGGISILGTTGVVRPFSCSAWIASIHRGIDVARANGMTHVIGSTGATSEKAAITRYAPPLFALLDMGDFVGGMLKYLRRHPVPNLTIAGGLAKMVKLGQGALDLHSARSQVDFELLASDIGVFGYDGDRVRTATSVMEVVALGDDDMAVKFASLVAARAQDAAAQVIGDAGVNVEVMIVARDQTCLARAGSIAP